MSELNPRNSDAILGGQTPPPTTGAILGGLAGAKQRLESETILARLSALTEAFRYGEQGNDLAVQALNDSSDEVQQLAYRLLRSQGSEKGKQALLNHQPLRYFTTLSDWRFETYNAEIGITDPENNAYVVCVAKQTVDDADGLSQLESLLCEENITEVQALVINIDFIRRQYYSAAGDNYHSFGAAMEAICDAKERLPNLRALYIGDGAADVPEFKKSKMPIFDIRPFLDNFPKLEVLQVFGNFGRDNYYTLECSGLRHENLKTLIIETAYIEHDNLKQLCSMDLPKLELFELWLGRTGGIKSIMSALEPILAGYIYPNLKSFGLCSAEEHKNWLPEIVNAPFMEQIAVLDFKMGTMVDANIEPLLNLSLTQNLKALNVTGNQLSSSAIAQLSQQPYQLISTYQYGLNEFPDYEDENYDENRTTRHAALYE
jgi:hypothetical protein